MVNAGMVRVVNEKMVMNVELVRTKDEWLVRGEKDGKAIEALLDDVRGPDAILASVRDVREVLARENPVGSVVEIRKWDQVDPTQLETAQLRITQIIDEEHARTTFESPLSRVEYVVDRRTGLIVSSILETPSGAVEGKRIYSVGSPLP